METTFDFDDLQLPEFGEGALFSGRATLTDDCGEADHFIVTEIRLNGGVWLRKAGREFNSLSQHLFKAISDVLYDDKIVIGLDGKRCLSMGNYAAREWADFVEGHTTPDYTDVFKPRAGLVELVRGASI